MPRRCLPPCHATPRCLLSATTSSMMIPSLMMFMSCWKKLLQKFQICQLIESSRTTLSETVLSMEYASMDVMVGTVLLKTGSCKYGGNTLRVPEVFIFSTIDYREKVGTLYAVQCYTGEGDFSIAHATLM